MSTTRPIPKEHVMIKYVIMTLSYIGVALLASVDVASALSFTDIAIVSPAGSDANNCVWHTPFAPPQPPACATGTHAATLLKGPSSKLVFLSGTYHEIVSVFVPKTTWPNVGHAFNIGTLSGNIPIFDGGGFAITGDGFVSIKGIRMKNGPGDCISVQGISATDTISGNIEDMNIYGCAGHINTLINTNAFEVGYDFYSDSGVNESEMFLSNSTNLNIHETQLQMLVGKHAQVGAYFLNSPGALFGVNVDKWVAPTGADIESSPNMNIIQGNSPYTVKICPATDVKTDTVAPNVTVTSNCIVQ